MANICFHSPNICQNGKKLLFQQKNIKKTSTFVKNQGINAKRASCGHRECRIEALLLCTRKMQDLTQQQIDYLMSHKEEVRQAFKDAKISLEDEANVQLMREELEKKPNDRLIIAQAGGQNNMLMSEADITIGGGSRGGSKSFSLLMSALYNVTDPNFRAIILRKELDDLSDIADTSTQLFQDFGTYNRSKNDMTWNFYSGGWLKFSYHNDDYQSFHDRFQGKQYAYIGIDEITQMTFPKFKYLITTNRNAFHYRNHVFGTCNPDPDSWVARFISWWIGEDGFPIRERDSKIRYCFMPSDYVEDVVWGDSKEEVFEKCKETIMRHWKPQFERYGSPQDLFVKSVCFTEARLEDNVMLMSSDPAYLANLVNQSEEARARDLDGNWKFKSAGDDMIKLSDIERFYNNPDQRNFSGAGEYRTESQQRYVTCDVAFEGGDQCVFMLWIGNHIEDIYTSQKDARKTVEIAQALLERWGVRQENFTYDLLGIGHIFKGYFPRAIPFNAKEAVEQKYKGMYYNLNAQAAYMFADHIKDGTYSINSDLLERRFTGKNYKNMLLREILNQERRCIRFRDDDPSRLIDKSVGMKRLIGRSPDFIDTMKMREIFNIKHIHHKPKNLGLVTGASEKVMKSRGVFPQSYNRRRMFNTGFRW